MKEYIKHIYIGYEFDFDEFIDSRYYDNNPSIIGFDFELCSLTKIDKIFKIFKQNKKLTTLSLNFFEIFEHPDSINYPSYSGVNRRKLKYYDSYKDALKDYINSYYKIFIKLITKINNLTSIKILNFKSFDIKIFNDIEINPNIKELYLCNDGISDLTPLHNKIDNIEILDLWNNNISDLTPLCEVLKSNTSIKRIELCYNNITNLEPLIKALETNQGLNEIYIKYNPFQSYRQLVQLKNIAEFKHIKIDI